ncbi:MAG: SPOR domain-containing protein [Candidatus Eisenbacteria bacterium]|uniref:SPOR domain-containing protein n=1 Tax=Eiseniibacteriota bacterium TaxID=2212470 RepID=A0A933W1R0_UNCEI|nr:SPOR domain-containing protein [Candidatus Eisenbacteria bacterium]
MRKPALVLLLACVLATPAHAALEQAWRAIPARVPAESLAVRLRSMELRPVAGVSPGAAAFALGQLHYARGEYRQAVEAFTRASGRLTGAERGEARYWNGLSALALGEAGPARTAFAEAAPDRRALAQLGIAQAWDLEQRPDKAYDVLRMLLAGDAGEATAPALDKFAQVAERLHRPDEAARVRSRLAREFGGTIEAARTTTTPPAAAGAANAGTDGEVAIQIGAFGEEARARTLAESARRAGFAEATVLRRPTPDGRATLHVVRLGRYPNREEARKAGERVQRALGVGWQVEKP